MDKDTANMLGSVGGSVVSAGLGMLDSHLSRRYNERMIDKQNAWNLAQWHRENAYNAPSAVVQRLKNANINPALAYMNGASFAPAATSPQSGASQARSFGLQMDPMLMANIRLQNAQADLAKAEAKNVEQKTPHEVENLVELNNKLRADVRKLSAEEQDIYQQWTFREAEIAISQQTANGQIERWNAQNGLDEQLKLKTSEEYCQLVALFNLREQGLRLTNAEIRSRIKVNYAEAERLQKMLSVMTQDVIESQSRTERNYTQNYLDARAQGLDEAMAPFRAQLEQDQADLANKQATYWDDYVHNPLKYNVKPTDFSPFMPRRGRR